MAFGDFGRLYQFDSPCKKCGRPIGDHKYRKDAEPACPVQAQLCEGCARPLSLGEVYWYGRDDGKGGRCEDCERAWSERMRSWMRGETVEPELDSMFSAPPSSTP